MKYFIILIGILTASLAYGQRLEKSNGHYVLVKEDSISGRDKNEIFESINKWIEEKFTPQNILIKDAKDGKLSARGTIQLNDISHLISCVMKDVQLHFNINISIQEESYKVIFNDMIITNQTVCYQSNGSPPTIQQFEHPLEKLHLSNKKTKKTLTEIEGKLLLLSKELDAFIKGKYK